MATPAHETTSATEVGGRPELGKARLRKEDARLLTGQTNWTDNIVLPGMLHMCFVRSPMAHARITSVDLSAARAMPGVIAAFSGADFAEEQGSLPCAWPVTEDIVIPPHPPMATEEVRYPGEAVAVVVARDRYTAADAAAAVDVSYEPLPAVLDIRTALDEGSPKVHPEGNKSFEWVFAQGDLDEAFRGAPVVIERNYRQQRLIPSAMEPRAVVASCVGGEFTLWSATQIPHVLRVMLALVTGIPEQNIRVIAPDVGGGFGSKLQVTAEEVLAMLVTRRLGRPVKWTESRSEGNLTVHHGRDQWQRIRIAADSDGRLRGLSVDLLADMGAYLMLVTPGVPLLGAFMFPAIYKMDAYSFRCTGVFTTKMPTDAYRGAGRPEATFAIERIMDELAAELGVDPLEVRERNWIKHEEFPYTTIATLVYDSGNYEAATARAKELFGYDALRAEQKARRESGDLVQLGIGVSTYTEMCGLAPSRVLGSLAYGAGGWEHASIRMLPTGKVEVVTGSSAHGQGHETAWSQIVSDQLGVPFEDIRVLHGDTQVSPKGMDTYGSRSLAVGGMALVGACDKVIAKAKRITAHMLEAAEPDIEFTSGRLHVRGDPEKGYTIQEVALATFAAHNLPDGMEPSLDSDATYDPDNFSFPHGTHLCAVEVDTETGMVTIRSYVAVDDIGKVINPLIVDGQVHGGIAQGIAQALYEEAVYDDDGNLLTTTLADYLVPSAADLPHLTTDRTESPASNRLGVKGVGEAGTIASTPAVVNAIVDALRPFGVNDVPMPCTPERVWRAIQAAQHGALQGGEEIGEPIGAGWGPPGTSSGDGDEFDDDLFDDRDLPDDGEPPGPGSGDGAAVPSPGDGTDAQHVNFWIREREQAPNQSLIIGTTYTGVFRVGEYVTANIARGERDIPYGDIPSAGLDTTWIVSSTTAALMKLEGGGIDELTTGPFDGGQHWTARFKLRIPPAGSSEERVLLVMPHQPLAHLDVAIYVRGDVYRKVWIDLQAQATATTPPGSSHPPRPDVRHAARRQGEDVRNRSVLVVPAAEVGIRTPPGHECLSVHLYSGRAYRRFKLTGDEKTRPWPLSSIAEQRIASVRMALDSLRENHTEWLDSISPDDLDQALQNWNIDHAWTAAAAPRGQRLAGWARDPWLREFAFHGSKLFDALFPPESDLRRAVLRLNPGDRLHIAWFEEGGGNWIAHVPWALVYAKDAPPRGGTVDPERFLGLRLRLSYSSREIEEGTRALLPSSETTRAQLLYWGEGPDDLVAAEARRQRVELARFVPYVLPKRASQRKAEICRFLARPKPVPVTLVYVYCQSQPGSGAAPVLRFGSTNEGDDLVELMDIGTRKMRDQPLMFVNACESAAADPFVVNELEESFLDRGCRAFIGTQTKVPVQFASRFASAFFYFLYQEQHGEPISAGEALTLARRFFWDKYRNIGGLFYSYVNDYELVMADKAPVIRP